MSEWKSPYCRHLVYYAVELVPEAEAAALRLGAPQVVSIGKTGTTYAEGDDAVIRLQMPDGSWRYLGSVWFYSGLLDAVQELGWRWLCNPT